MIRLHQIISRSSALAMPLLVLAMGLPALAAAATSPVALAAADPTIHPSPLISKVREATARYKDINVAISEGFAQATPCVSGPNSGAMGVHFVLFDRVTNGVLSADQPESLIYEPMPNGAMRLVGVEFIVLVATWESMHPGSGPPALDGHLLNLVSAPNRYGLPAFYEMHVWAWEHNPVGSFADWNTRVTCEQQPGN
jgi:hypothetical protein